MLRADACALLDALLRAFDAKARECRHAVDAMPCYMPATMLATPIRLMLTRRRYAAAPFFPRHAFCFLLMFADYVYDIAAADMRRHAFRCLLPAAALCAAF